MNRFLKIFAGSLLALSACKKTDSSILEAKTAKAESKASLGEVILIARGDCGHCKTWRFNNFLDVDKQAKGQYQLTAYLAEESGDGVLSKFFGSKEKEHKNDAAGWTSATGMQWKSIKTAPKDIESLFQNSHCQGRAPCLLVRNPGWDRYYAEGAGRGVDIERIIGLAGLKVQVTEKD